VLIGANKMTSVCAGMELIEGNRSNLF